MENQAIGRSGEQRAREYLERIGYKLLQANFRTRFGEVDLVMEDGNTLVFVEVKCRTDGSHGPPQEAVHSYKRDHMVRAALMFVKMTRRLEQNIRFDVISIDPGGVQHLAGAFEPDAGNYYY